MEKFTGIPCRGDKYTSSHSCLSLPHPLGLRQVQHSWALPKIIKSFRLEKTFKIEFNWELNIAEFPSKPHMFCLVIRGCHPILADFGHSRSFLACGRVMVRRDQRDFLQESMED